MLKIGDFARLALVTVQTLRHYDQLGLLRPDVVDEASGYRYYELEQLQTLHRILALKDLGLSLKQIRALLVEGLGEEDVHAMLRLKRSELEAQIEAQREQLLRVEARLALLQERAPHHEVALKTLLEQKAVAVRSELPTFAAIDALFERLDAHLAGHAVAPTGSCIARFPDARQRARERFPLADVEVATPVRTWPPDGDGVATRTLAAVPLAACIVHVGSYDALPQVHLELLAWCERHGYRPTGPVREVYLRFGDAATAYPDAFLARAASDFVTEVQLPVAKIHAA